MIQQSVDQIASLSINDAIASITVDIKSASVNTVSNAFLARIEAIFDELDSHTKLDGIILSSGKNDHFIAGFDIEALQSYKTDKAGLSDVMKRGHALLNRIENSPVPVLAAIHGTCLGAGLEIVLACHYRIATKHPCTRLGLPEVKLGLIPGAGGTQRLPRTIDLAKAIDMIISGRQLAAEQALNNGLVDELVHPDILMKAAMVQIKRLHDEHRSHDQGILASRFEGIQRNIEDSLADPVKIAARTPARKLIFSRAREQIMSATKGHYPAPLRAIDVIENGFSQGKKAGFEEEIKAFTELLETDVADNLMQLFFVQKQVQNDSVVPKNIKPRDIQKIGVVGAGLMGAGIAYLAASHHYPVRLRDNDMQNLGRGLRYSRELFNGLVKRERVSKIDAEIGFGQISGTASYDGFASADIVIEAVFEDLELKQRVVHKLEELGNEEQIIASNTSTIPISLIAEKAQRPENILGMHFFSPVHKMPLLEIIRTDKTAPKSVATALAIGRKFKKTCIVVNDGPGFFTSRVIGAYINEAGWLLQEGARIEDVDQAMVAFGFPVGPFQLMDEIGLDISLRAASILKNAFSDRWEAPQTLDFIARDGRKGRKNKKGFYLYNGNGNGAKKVDKSIYDQLNHGQSRRAMDSEIIQQRCWMAMLNECIYCLQENIIKRPRDVDIGVIFGLGFPAFRGGILRYADTLGVDYVHTELERMADLYGQRLRPAPLLERHAKKGQPFWD